jgi:hypothetical protein
MSNSKPVKDPQVKLHPNYILYTKKECYKRADEPWITQYLFFSSKDPYRHFPKGTNDPYFKELCTVLKKHEIRRGAVRTRFSSWKRNGMRACEVIKAWVKNGRKCYLAIENKCEGNPEVLFLIKCACCKPSNAYILCADHVHSTKKFRNILCFKCNLRLNQFLKTHLGFIEYLHKFEEEILKEQDNVDRSIAIDINNQDSSEERENVKESMDFEDFCRKNGLEKTRKNQRLFLEQFRFMEKEQCSVD